MPPSIEVKNLTKKYRIGSGLPSLRSLFFGQSKNENPENVHWAVKDISFELQPGEALAIIGPNGAGKTTTLKLLSQVTKPTEGEICINGRFSSLIELGAGFHPDLTGRENIYLNGTILGMKRADIDSRFDQIVDFAGIGQFLDTPVKRYSSGMYARLGFSIAAHVDPEILLVDEVLAVGDYAFQTKCHARMDELRAKGTALIFVSHNMDAVRRVCDRGLVMYRGEMAFIGTAAEAVVAYSDVVREAARKVKNIPTDNGLSQRVMSFEAEIQNVALLDQEGQQVTIVRSGDTAVVAIEVCFNEDVEHPIFALAIRTPDGRRVYASTTRWLKVETPNFAAGQRWRVEHKLELPLLNGTYDLSVNIGSNDLSHYFDRLERALSFQVIDGVEAKGVVDLNMEMGYHLCS